MKIERNVINSHPKYVENETSQKIRLNPYLKGGTTSPRARRGKVPVAWDALTHACPRCPAPDGAQCPLGGCATLSASTS